jgi:hypothetical protein
MSTARLKLLQLILVPALAAFLLVAAPARAQVTSFGQTPEPQKDPHKKSKHGVQPATPSGPKPSIPPSFTIPVDALGFASPGPVYTWQRSTMASLDFLDDDHLLFTFRVPGLLKRDPNYGSGQDSGERQVRAILLSLPSGTIEAEDLWTLHDHDRYLWPIGNGRFILRNGNELSEGDLTLKLHPTLRFPGSITSLRVDPLAKFIVTNSNEPTIKPQPAPTPAPAAKPHFESITPSTSPEPQPDDATTSTNTAAANESQNNIVRILDHASGKVLLVSRSTAPTRLVINSTGYLQPIRQLGRTWALQLIHFAGGQNRVTFVDSDCLPYLDFISDTEIMATICEGSDSTRLVALTTDGRELWHLNSPSGTIWPQLANSANGLRLARESLTVNHSISASAPLDADDVKAQRVTVYDAATGHIALTAYATPILSEGGNFALSPSGRRAAILNNGQLQIWNLDPPPPLPTQTAP